MDPLTGLGIVAAAACTAAALFGLARRRSRQAATRAREQVDGLRLAYLESRARSLARSKAWHATMLHITRDLDLALDAPVGLSRVMRHLVYRHGYEAACALLLDPHTDALVPVVATGARKKITKQSLELANKAILSGELAVQLSSIPRRPDSQALLRAVPLSGPLGVEGVLLLRSRQDHDLHETAFVEQLGMTVGHWLTHSRSHQQLRRLADHLNRSGREVSRRLALAGGRS